MTVKPAPHRRNKAAKASNTKPARAPAPPGLPARQAAVKLLVAVLHERRSLDEALADVFASGAASTLEPRDRALARLIAGTVLRRLGELEAVLKSFLEKPLPDRQGCLWPILLSGAAQLLFLETPPHAAVGLAVEQARCDHRARRFDGLVNALLRRVAREGASVLEGLDPPRLNIPGWLFDQWTKTYGENQARRIAQASLAEAPLDISVKADAQAWAERLGGSVLPTGSIRLAAGGRIEDLPGYADGAWWVQDAGAALPARLLGPVAGQSIADLCAAPGGKTAQLSAAGARVTAVDASEARLSRVRANLGRLLLNGDLVAADVTTWKPGRTFDAVLLDAPCTSTGTIRRHPDILRLKRPEDISALAALQTRLLDNAVNLVKPGGTLVYCVCSLEPEEGERQITGLLARNAAFTRRPICAGESGIAADWLTPDGDLRTLPFHLAQERKELSGLDGFFAARLVRRG